MPRATITIGFADDKLIMAKEGTIFEVEGHDITALCVALECIRGLGLELAVEKIQAVMFTKRWGFVAPTVVLEGEQVPLSLSLKYLGIHLEKRDDI